MTTPAEHACEFSPDGHYLAVGTILGYVELWDLETKTLAFRWQPHGGKLVRQVAFTPDGAVATMSDADDGLRILDLRDQRARLNELGLDW
jgi:WD40 repeat protein